MRVVDAVTIDRLVCTACKVAAGPADGSPRDVAVSVAPKPYRSSGRVIRGMPRRDEKPRQATLDHGRSAACRASEARAQ